MEVANLLAETVREVMLTNGKAQVYSRLASSDRDKDGKKNDDYYGVLYGAHQVGTAGIILEHSFHTNARAATWLLDESNLKLLAEAKANAIAGWFGLDGSNDGTEEAPSEPAATEVTVLQKGMKGAKVKAMQILLIGHGYSCGNAGADGDFGSNTEKALKAYQKDNSLDPDGVCGPKSLAALLGYV